jgi:hypothetical protein
VAFGAPGSSNSGQDRKAKSIHGDLKKSFHVNAQTELTEITVDSRFAFRSSEWPGSGREATISDVPFHLLNVPSGLLG